MIAERRIFRSRQIVSLAVAVSSVLVFFGSAVAQSAVEPSPTTAAERLGPVTAARYRVGAKITAKGGTVQNIRVMVAVPLECVEQQVQVVNEDFSPLVENVEYRILGDNAARQMLIYIPQLSPRQSAQALVTYEVATHTILPPQEVAHLTPPRKVDRKLKLFLTSSPYIEVNHRKIRTAVRDALAARPAAKDAAQPAEGDATDATDAAGSDDEADPYDDVTEPDADAPQDEPAEPLAVEEEQEPAPSATPSIIADTPPAEVPPGELTAWQRVEKLYDYAREKVTYEEGVDKSAVQVLAEGRGDCQAIGALFVAMCRTEEIPARLVWVDGHQFAEFYLEHAKGQGQWYPIETSGRRAFGEMPLARVILQKGDKFSVPERRRERLRYASDYAMFLSSPKYKPKVEYIHEQL